GLLSEEYDTQRRRLVGNFPQAFSHVALINTAFNLTRSQISAEQRVPIEQRAQKVGASVTQTLAPTSETAVGSPSTDTSAGDANAGMDNIRKNHSTDHRIDNTDARNTVRQIPS